LKPRCRWEHRAWRSLEPRADYARAPPDLVNLGGSVRIGGALYLHASHPLTVDGGSVAFTLPKGETGWAVLADMPPRPADRDRWLVATLAYWRRIASRARYERPYREEVAVSLRAIRLLSHQARGGIVAAATTSLPEIPGGNRNWDHCYVWLRNLTRTLTLELAPDRSNVNDIAPGMVLTPMNQQAVDDPGVREKQVQSIPFKRAAEPWGIARLAIYLASAEADFATSPTFTLDGGRASGHHPCRRWTLDGPRRQSHHHQSGG